MSVRRLFQEELFDTTHDKICSEKAVCTSVQQEHVYIEMCSFSVSESNVFFVGRLSSSCLTECASWEGGEGEVVVGPQNVMLTSPGLISLTEV